MARKLSESLRQIAAALAMLLDRDVVLQQIIAHAHTVLNFDSGAIFLLDGDALVLAAGAGFDPQLLGQRVPLDGRGPSARVYATGQMHIIPDATVDPDWVPWTPNDPIRSWMGVPLNVGGRVIGVLSIDSFRVADFDKRDGRILQTFADHAAIAIHNAQLFHGLEDANRQIAVLNERLALENLRLNAQIEVTRRLQEMILPRHAELAQVEGLDIAAYMEPATHVGGDYYDVLQRDGQVKIAMGDVTDHGLESGMIMLMAQTAVRTLLNAGESDPVRFLDIINRTIYDNVRRMQADRNASLVVLDYTPGTARISGQHEDVIIVRRSGDVERLATTFLGFPLGLEPDIRAFIDSVTIPLEPGDGLVLYTDGITEAENKAGELYGIERLCEAARRHWPASAERVRDGIIADVAGHVGNHTVFDDVALVVVKRV